MWKAFLVAVLCVSSVAAQCVKPIITNAVATPDATGQQITVTWTTSVPADSLVAYGIPNPGTFTAVTDTAGVTSHSVTITGLQPSTQYGWGIRSQAINGGVGCGVGYYAFFNGPAAGSVTTHAAPAGVFTYEIVPVGPTYVTQGYGLYFQIRLVLLTGNYTTRSLTMVLSGLPTGSSIRWSDTELWNVDVDTISTTTIPHDTVLLHAFDFKEPYIKTSSTTPSGNYTITITVSGTGGPTVTATWPLNVVSSSAPFSGVALPSGIPASYPPIPNLSTYLASANTYGQQNCAQDQDATNRVIRPNDTSNLTPVATCCTYQTWFYDGVMVYYNVENLLKNGLNWGQCRTNVQQVYQPYVLNNSTQTFMQFSEGAYLDYLKTGSANDLAQINKFNGALQYAYHGNYVDVGYLQREVAYVARNLTHGVALGQNVSTPYGQTSAFMRDYAEDHVLGMVDQICLSRNAQYWENFMVGLQAEALLQYWTLAGKDPRIPPALACLADYLYANQWQVNDTGSFPYDKYQAVMNLSAANGSTSCMNTLNNLISPMYAWLFMMTGLSQYQTEGDTIFSHGVLFDCPGSQGIQAYLTWPSNSNGKNYSQQYLWGPDYVYWRSPVPPQPTTPWPVTNGGVLP